MARVRDETHRFGTRQGMVRGLAVTGEVITSAGIVLAAFSAARTAENAASGTFLVLAMLPLVFPTEIGFVIAFGVLLGTFVVRSVLVPALVLDMARESGGRHGSRRPTAASAPSRSSASPCWRAADPT